MIATADNDAWTDLARKTLDRFAEPLLRDVAARLVKPRTPISAEEQIDRLLGVLSNPPVLDRRIKELPDASRKALALMGVSRRPVWKVGHLITSLAAIGHSEGFTPILKLLESGLAFPELPAGTAPITDFEPWLGLAGTLHAKIFTLPTVAARARGEDLNLPALPSEPLEDATGRVSDGLDWPLRIAVIWQLIAESPARLTQANSLFKRDLTRLQATENLAGADDPQPVPDQGVLAFFWAQAAGLVVEGDNEWIAGPFPATWNQTLTPALSDLWAGLASLEAWDPLTGYAPSDGGLSPTPTAGLLSLLLLTSRGVHPHGNSNWYNPQILADWLWEHHPSWSGAISQAAASNRGRDWVIAYFLSVAYPLRLVEVAQQDGWKFRLSDLGRHLLENAPEPAPAAAFPQTLLVQPNAEILAYRQGLTPGLIARLSRFAQWKGIGPACTLELTPTRTYAGLETGLTLAGILQTLNQHGMKPVPVPVADLVRRWADKRDRITAFASATLVEFQTTADLEIALARGVVSVRVTDRIGLTDDGRDPDFANLRLVGNRDYEAKPQRCIQVDHDGVTLLVDSSQSDLLMEAEIGKIADPVVAETPGTRKFLVTPTSLRRAIAAGLGLADLDTWFVTRTGQPLPPAGRLFVLGPTLPPPSVERFLVVQMPSEEVTDGILQWPDTADLITDRLGPKSLVVDDENLPRLIAVLADLGITLPHGERGTMVSEPLPG